jgi:hypothetical protein
MKTPLNLATLCSLDHSRRDHQDRGGSGTTTPGDRGRAEA